MRKRYPTGVSIRHNYLEAKQKKNIQRIALLQSSGGSDRFFSKKIDNEVAGKESTQINPVRVLLNNFSFAKIAYIYVYPECLL